MSVLGRLFGSGKKGEKAPTAQEAIQRLRETEDMLSKKSDYLEKKIGAEIAIARKHGTKNKRGRSIPGTSVALLVSCTGHSLFRFPQHYI
jgi:hypothetical protein